MDRETFVKLLIEDGRYKQYNTKIVSIYSSKELSFELFKFEDDKTEIAYQGFLLGQKVVVEEMHVLNKQRTHKIPPPPQPPPCTGVGDDKSWFPKRPKAIEMPIITR